MRQAPARHGARLLGRLLEHVYPRDQAGWVRAMRSEIEQVERDGAAFRFALGCLWGGCRQALAEQVSSTAKGVATMAIEWGKLRQPRNAGIACGVAATCLGISYLVLAGAPGRYMIVNAVALLLGIVAATGFAGVVSQHRRFASAAVMAFGACLLATALFGASADGAARWIRIGPLGVQVSLVLLPFLIVAFARHQGAVGAAGIAVAAAALALQPDRAMSGVLAFSMAVLAIARPGRAVLASLVAAIAGCAVALARPDTNPAVPYVDRILYTSFDVHILAGAAVVLGSMLLLVPAILGLGGDPERRHVHLLFGSIWLGCVVAAALGNYPTPVVGYGGSAILGYLLSLSVLPKESRAAAGEPGAAAGDEVNQGVGLSKRVLAA
jgi:hypothetical protein